MKRKKTVNRNYWKREEELIIKFLDIMEDMAFEQIAQSMYYKF